jgi:ferredoxin--NADP+ reductase
MSQIIAKQQIADGIWRYEFEARRVAVARKPGQFVVLQVDESGERFPLTIVDSDATRGTITLVFQVVGTSTMKLAGLNVGDSVKSILGPLGNPTHIENWGTVAAVGGGVGIACLYPIVKGMSTAGNRVVTILGARSRGLILLESEIRPICSETWVVTDDGSYGRKGFVTDALRQLLDSQYRFDLVLAVGPLVMMQAVSELTRARGIKTMVSLNPIMVDGTGMCGGCRVEVGGKVRFACVDGPEFDGHEVNFPRLAARLRAYKKFELQSMERWKEGGHGQCRRTDQTRATETTSCAHEGTASGG